MKFLVYALNGTLLGSRVGGGAFVFGSGVSTAQGCYLEIEASGGAVTVLATIDITALRAITGVETLTFVCPAETVADGDTLRLYLSDTSSTYYDSNYMYGGDRHSPALNNTRLPYFHPVAAYSALDSANDGVVVLDSETYECPDWDLNRAITFVLALLGQTPRLTAGVGIRITREVIHDGNNTDTIYVAKTGSDAGSGTYQLPYLTIQFAENNMGGLSYLNIMDSGVYEETVAISVAITIEPIYGKIPTATPATVSATLFSITDPAVNIYGIAFDGGYLATDGISINVNSYAGTIKDNEIYSVIQWAIECGFRNVVTIFSGTISYNKIHDNRIGITITTTTSDNGTRDHNIVYSNSDAGIFTDSRGDTTDTVSNNLVYGNGDFGIILSTDGDFGSTIINNTIPNTYLSTVVTDGQGSGLWYTAGVFSGTIRDNIVYGSETYDLYKQGISVSTPVITESNYGTNSGFTAGGTNITTDPEFCKDISPFEFGISANSGAYRTGTGSDDMGAHFRIIEINASTITINGFLIDGQDQYNNAIYIADAVNHITTSLKWNSVYDFQGIEFDPYDDGTDTDCTVSNCKFYNGGNGIKFTRGGNTVENCLIYNNTIFGIHSNHTGQTFNHNVFYRNQYGLYIEANSGGLSIKNNIFSENSSFGIYSEVIINTSSFTYNCIRDAVNSNVDKTDTSNFTDNPLFINTNLDSEDFNIKTIETGFSFDSPCKDSSDDTPVQDVGAYDVSRSINTDAWKKYELEFNSPKLTYNLISKGFRRFESGNGDFDSFAKGHRRSYDLNFGARNQVSSEELRQKMEYFSTLIKTRENEIVDNEEIKLRFHLQPTSFLVDSNGVITTSNNNVADAAAAWVENQWKGFHVGIKWKSGTNMTIDSLLKTGTVGGAAWTVDQWIGYYSYINGLYYFIKSNTADALTFSDPNDTLVDGFEDWNIEKYFKILSNTVNALCLEDPDGELIDGTFDYYIDFIEVRVTNPRFAYSQPVFLHAREHSKTNYRITVEEI